MTMDPSSNQRLRFTVVADENQKLDNNLLTHVLTDRPKPWIRKKAMILCSIWTVARNETSSTSILGGDIGTYRLVDYRGRHTAWAVRQSFCHLLNELGKIVVRFVGLHTPAMLAYKSMSALSWVPIF